MDKFKKITTIGKFFFIVLFEMV